MGGHTLRVNAKWSKARKAEKRQATRGRPLPPSPQSHSKPITHSVVEVDSLRMRQSQGISESKDEVQLI